MIDNVCLGFWSLNLIYQSLTIAYLILLCGDVEYDPGPNLHNLQTLEDYEKHKGNANSYLWFVYTNIRNVNKHYEISDFFAAAEHKLSWLFLKHG